MNIVLMGRLVRSMKPIRVKSSVNSEFDRMVPEVVSCRTLGHCLKLKLREKHCKNFDAGSYRTVRSPARLPLNFSPSQMASHSGHVTRVASAEDYVVFPHFHQTCVLIAAAANSPGFGIQLSCRHALSGSARCTVRCVPFPHQSRHGLHWIATRDSSSPA